MRFRIPEMEQTTLRLSLCRKTGERMDRLKPQELRQRAREILDASMTMANPERRKTLIQLAAYYEELAVKLDNLTSPLGQLDPNRPPKNRH